jgi:hypothetical protein
MSGQATHIVAIDLRVLDGRALLAAATERAREDATQFDCEIDLLTNEDGSPNVAHCLLMLLNPGRLDGCEILGADADCTGVR